MSIFSNLFARKRDAPKITAGRITTSNFGLNTILSPYRSRVADTLTQLRSISETTAAIDFLRKVHPDVSMAVWNFIRLANQGHEMRIYDIRNRNNRLSRVEAKWNEFAARVNAINNSGLDGLIDQLHLSAYLRGGMGIEAEVSEDLTDIVDVYPILPQSLEWRLEERNNKKVWIPYQRQSQGAVSLENANFFWVPTDPDIDDPRGILVLAPVLYAIDFQMQILQDLQAVLHNQGYPRYDVSTTLERLISTMPPNVKADPQKQRDWLMQHLNWIKQLFDSLNPDDAFIHFDDITVNILGQQNARSLDVRAVTELLDTLLLSGAKQLAIFMNRVGSHGQTESWGSISFKIYCSALRNIQRGSKRLIENVARLALQVWGYQGIPVFTHNVLDWQSEEDKWNVNLLKQQFYAIAQMMGWIGADEAASEVVDVEKAVSEVPSEAIRVSFGIGGDDPDTNNGKSRLQQSNTRVYSLWRKNEKAQ